MHLLIDTHAHLEEIKDLAQAIHRAKEAGVEAIVGVGQDDQSNKELLRACAEYKDILTIYPALGVHPGCVDECDLDGALVFIEKNIKGIVAIGEIGLDFWYKQARREGPGREAQRTVFKKQLDLAIRYHKPVIVHSRGSWRACLEMVRQREMSKVNFHWYSGPQDVLDEILELDYVISATCAAEYSKEHRCAIEKAALGNILLETDSPVRYKPESGTYSSQPKDVLRTLKAVAKIKKISCAQVAEVTRANAIRFFNLKVV